MNKPIEKTWYPAIAKSAPYMCPYIDKYVVKADIVQKTQIKEAQRLYVPQQADIDIGDTLTCEWHNQLRMYKVIHTMNQDLHTDESCCFGGFYYIDGTQA